MFLLSWIGAERISKFWQAMTTSSQINLMAIFWWIEGRLLFSQVFS
jgi:hypothetical protein